MSLVLADVGADAILEAYFNNTWPTSKDLTLKLFVTNVTPGNTDTNATYTEAVGGGYAAKTLTNGSWTVADSGGIMQATYAAQSFVFTGPLTTNLIVYGYYIIDDDNNLIVAETLSANYTPSNNGDTLIINPVIQLSYGTPA